MAATLGLLARSLAGFALAGLTVGCATPTTSPAEASAMQQRRLSANCGRVFDAARSTLESQGFSIAQADRQSYHLTTDARNPVSDGNVLVKGLAGALLLPIKWNVSIRCEGGSNVRARLFNVMRDGTLAEMTQGESVAKAYSDFFDRMNSQLGQAR